MHSEYVDNAVSIYLPTEDKKRILVRLSGIKVYVAGMR